MNLWTIGALLIFTSAAAGAQPRDPTTYNRDVAPILWKHCTSCHRPGQSAPFSLLTFEDVRPRASAIARAVETGSMPPWQPEPGYGDFEEPRRMSARDRQVLQEWAADGFLRGSPPDAGIPPSPDRWQLGEPDLVIEMARPLLPRR